MELGGSDNNAHGGYGQQDGPEGRDLGGLPVEACGDRASQEYPGVDEDLLPTTVAPEVAEFGTVDTSLSTAYAEQQKINEGAGRISRLEAQATDLQVQLALVQSDADQQHSANDVSRRHIANTLQYGRTALWREMYISGYDGDDHPGYVTGAGNIKDAVQLNPPDDSYESDSLRRARANAVITASERIVAGQPTLITVSADVITFNYTAGIAAHDGFSLHRGTHSPEAPEFELGLNDQPAVYINDGWCAKEMLDTPPQVLTSVAVFSGEDAKALLNYHGMMYAQRAGEAQERLDDVARPWHPGHQEAQMSRKGACEGLVDVITAARGMEMTVMLPGKEHQVAQVLTEYLFDQADSQPYALDTAPSLLAIAAALKDIYPKDAETDVADHIIRTSLERYHEIAGRHNMTAFAVIVTKAIFGVHEHDERYRVLPPESLQS